MGNINLTILVSNSIGFCDVSASVRGVYVLSRFIIESEDLASF